MHRFKTGPVPSAGHVDSRDLRRRKTLSFFGTMLQFMMALASNPNIAGGVASGAPIRFFVCSISSFSWVRGFFSEER
jgi:hypothetical protein